MLKIDGSWGEGGGQILRSSLALAMLTQTPFQIVNIRAKRSRPGLLRQHLTAVSAAAQLSGAEVEGAELRSTSLTFKPGALKGGAYTFTVGTAGSATLVLQAVLPALMVSKAEWTLTLEGGTHNPLAPPFDALARSFLPLVARMGCVVETVLERPGFYPAGGGRFVAKLKGGAKLSPLQLLERGELRQTYVKAMVAGLPKDIAQRELAVVAKKLKWDSSCFRTEVIHGAHGPGNVLMVEVASEHLTEVFTGFGEKGVCAEAVGAGVADEVLEYLASQVPVGQHLADQLLLPMALAGGGVFRTLPPTDHTRTQVEVLRQFGLAEVRLVEESAQCCRVEVSASAST